MMLRRIATAAAIMAIALVDPAGAPERDYPPFKVVANGGAAGGDWLNAPMGTLGGVRNVEGGWLSGDRSDLNLDIGAGNDIQRGNVVFNYDIGRCTVIFDGHERRIAKFCPSGIIFYRPVRYK